MRGEKIGYQANKRVRWMIIFVLSTVLILSSMPAATALPTLLTINGETLLENSQPVDRTHQKTPTYTSTPGPEKGKENALNNAWPDLKRGDDIPLKQFPHPNSPLLIHLKSVTFDPLTEEPKLSPGWVYTSDNGYYMIQCFGPMQSIWMEEIRATGVSILGYIPSYTYIMHMEGEEKEALSNLPYIRWVGRYHPAYKIQNGLREKVGEIELNVVVFKNEEDNLHKVRDNLRALGGIITHDGEENHIIRTKIDASKIRDIAFIPEVEWIDEFSPPIAMMNNVRVFTGAENLFINDPNHSHCPLPPRLYRSHLYHL